MKTTESNASPRRATQHSDATDIRSQALDESLDEFIRYLAGALADEYLERLKTGPRAIELP